MSKLNAQELQAALLQNMMGGQKKQNGFMEVGKSWATRAMGGLVGMMPVTNNKFTETVDELMYNDAEAMAAIMDRSDALDDLVEQLQALGLPVEIDRLNPVEIKENAVLLMAQNQARREAQKLAEKEQRKAERMARIQKFTQNVPAFNQFSFEEEVDVPQSKPAGGNPGGGRGEFDE